MSLCFSGDCCCEAALCSNPPKLGTKKKLVFRVLKRQNSRSFRGFCPPGSPPGSCPGPTGGLTRPPNPQLNFAPPPPNINYFPTALSLLFKHFILSIWKNDMKLKQYSRRKVSGNLVFSIIL